MKKTILSLAILSYIGVAQAEFFVQFPVDVKFVKGEGQVTASETPPKAIDCETQAEQYPEECTPTVSAWEQFAIDKNLAYSTDWNSIAWTDKLLTSIPTELYPNANPNSSISLNSNQLKNVDGLSSLTTVGGTLNLASNQLENILGLRNLTSVGELYIYSNTTLTNLDGLSNLTTVNGHLMALGNWLYNVNGLSNVTEVKGTLYLQNNQITDMTGLSNMAVTSSIILDSTYNGPKMLASSRFCTLNAGTKFSTNFAQKTQVCEDAPVTWESFASDKGLTYGTNWNDINWADRALTSIPTELYPNTNPTSYISLNNNQLKNVDGLASLNSVGDSLDLYSNQLENIAGLTNLTSVGTLNIHTNKLTNLDSLSKLTTVNGPIVAYTNLLTNVNGLSNVTEIKNSLYLYNNQITDITGLSNAYVYSNIMIDNTYNGPKMLASSRFCSLNDASKFPSNYAQKTQLCEI